MFRTPDGKNHALTFLLVSGLFFLTGVGSGMVDVLSRHFQNSLHLSKAHSAWVQGCWFGAYFLLAFPAGLFARRHGYRGGILCGLAMVAVGCLCFVPATRIVADQMIVFGFFLLALGLVAGGFAFIVTAANPYATLLGSTEGGVARINLAQGCNAVGWVLGPLLVSSFMLSKSGEPNTSNVALHVPYVLVGGIVTVLMISFALAPVPELQAGRESRVGDYDRLQTRPLHHEWHFVLGLVAQFLYCAAQAGIFSSFINCLKDPLFTPGLPAWLTVLLPAEMKHLRDGVWLITDYGAGAMLSLAFIFFAVGRFSGSLILRFAPAHRVLGIFGCVNVVLMGVVVAGLGWVSIVALTLSFLFMSIMYPTNFALTIRGLGERTKLASACLVTTIVGGAVLPIIMGWFADHSSIRMGFLIPMTCFACITAYAFTWTRLYRRDEEPEASVEFEQAP